MWSTCFAGRRFARISPGKLLYPVVLLRRPLSAEFVAKLSRARQKPTTPSRWR